MTWSETAFLCKLPNQWFVDLYRADAAYVWRKRAGIRPAGITLDRVLACNTVKRGLHEQKVMRACTPSVMPAFVVLRAITCLVAISCIHSGAQVLLQNPRPLLEDRETRVKSESGGADRGKPTERT